MAESRAHAVTSAAHGLVVGPRRLDVGVFYVAS